MIDSLLKIKILLRTPIYEKKSKQWVFCEHIKLLLKYRFLECLLKSQSVLTMRLYLWTKMLELELWVRVTVLYQFQHPNYFWLWFGLFTIKKILRTCEPVGRVLAKEPTTLPVFISHSGSVALLSKLYVSSPSCLACCWKWIYVNRRFWSGCLLAQRRTKNVTSFCVK
jgi:hypothetical protein